MRLRRVWRESINPSLWGLNGNCLMFCFAWRRIQCSSKRRRLNDPSCLELRLGLVVVGLVASSAVFCAEFCCPQFICIGKVKLY